MMYRHLPPKQGLYDPQFEHDGCGVGFVCDIKGRRSYDIVKKGISVLERLSHRGAVGADPKTGDGAGLLIQIPHDFLSNKARECGIALPDKDHYGAGLIFLPREDRERDFCIKTLERIVGEQRQRLLGWRDVPVDNSIIGETAKETEPVIRQVFIGRDTAIKDQLQFERKLYVIRRQAENTISS